MFDEREHEVATQAFSRHFCFQAGGRTTDENTSRHFRSNIFTESRDGRISVELDSPSSTAYDEDSSHQAFAADGHGLCFLVER